MAGPPNAVYIVYNFSYVVNGYQAGTFSGPDFNATLTNQPSMTLDTTASSDIFSQFGEEQQYIGYVIVYGEVVGPQSVSVPIDVNYFASDSTSITPGGYADAQSKFVFSDGLGDSYVAGQINIIGYNSGSQSVGGTYSMMVQTNTPFSVLMTGTDTMYGVNYTSGLGEQSSIYMDPMIYIDPSFGSTAGYDLQLSPGVQNIGPSSSAPEPATWAMMLAGVGALGATMRSQRRKPAARIA